MKNIKLVCINDEIQLLNMGRYGTFSIGEIYDGELYFPSTTMPPHIKVYFIREDKVRDYVLIEDELAYRYFKLLDEVRNEKLEKLLSF